MFKNKIFSLFAILQKVMQKYINKVYKNQKNEFFF